MSKSKPRALRKPAKCNPAAIRHDAGKRGLWSRELRRIPRAHNCSRPWLWSLQSLLPPARWRVLAFFRECWKEKVREGVNWGGCFACVRAEKDETEGEWGNLESDKDAEKGQREVKGVVLLSPFSGQNRSAPESNYVRFHASLSGSPEGLWPQKRRRAAIKGRRGGDGRGAGRGGGVEKRAALLPSSRAENGSTMQWLPLQMSPYLCLQCFGGVGGGIAPELTRPLYCHGACARFCPFCNPSTPPSAPLVLQHG